MYKIKLDDNSFIVADDTYKLTLFKGHKKRTVSIKEYLSNSKYWKYYLVDLIENKKYKRHFIIESIDSFEYELGMRFKYSQDIKIGDLLIGVDGSPRKVTELHTGKDEMFEISINGHTYTVNGGHILALVDKETGEHLEIPVNVYMHMDEEFKSHFVMEVVEPS